MIFPIKNEKFFKVRADDVVVFGASLMNEMYFIEDELTEYDRLLGITSASDEDKASALTKRDEAISKRMTGRMEDCETLMREALDLIPE